MNAITLTDYYGHPVVVARPFYALFTNSHGKAIKAIVHFGDDEDGLHVQETVEEIAALCSSRSAPKKRLQVEAKKP